MIIFFPTYSNWESDACTFFQVRIQSRPLLRRRGPSNWPQDRGWPSPHLGRIRERRGHLRLLVFGVTVCPDPTPEGQAEGQGQSGDELQVQGRAVDPVPGRPLLPHGHVQLHVRRQRKHSKQTQIAYLGLFISRGLRNGNSLGKRCLNRNRQRFSPNFRIECECFAKTFFRDDRSFSCVRRLRVYLIGF